MSATLKIENKDFEKEIKQALEKDKVAQDIIKNITDHDGFDEENGLLTFQGLIYIPTRCREGLYRTYHESKVYGHQGVDKIVERISRMYYFPKMRKYVEERIKSCDIYRKIKYNRHRLYRLMKSPSTLDRVQKSIAWDFIVKLPKSKERLTNITYNLILVITDRLTKYGYFIPYKESSNTEDLVYAFLRIVIANHGLPEEVISDRDKLFTSKLWKSLMD